MKKLLSLMIGIILSATSYAADWHCLNVDCTNDNNGACLKWTEYSVDFSGCTYVQVDLQFPAKRTIKVLVNVSDGNRQIMQKEIVINKGDDTSYAKEIYLGKSSEGQRIYFTIESIRCN